MTLKACVRIASFASVGWVKVALILTLLFILLNGLDYICRHDIYIYIYIYMVGIYIKICNIIYIERNGIYLSIYIYK